MSLRNVKGTRDLLPPQTDLWQAVERVVHEVFGLYGYSEIRTPVLEETELFVRGVGESSDIVGKEMFTFADRKGRSLTLRPENTAAVARAFLQHGMQKQPAPVKWYYVGPQFRYERPQRGRYRQFHQIGAELLGDEGPTSDAELLLMLMRFLGRLQFTDLEVRLNTVGDADSRRRYSEALRQYLEPHRTEISADSQERLIKNPLRILDSKSERDQEILSGAPQLQEFLSPACREHFTELCRLLDQWQIRYSVEDRLVRGLDYYTRTVFEIASSDLGAQDAILGGGRYDGLTSDLGGPAVPGIGFAIGQDRLLDVLPESFHELADAQPPLVVIPVEADQNDLALAVTEELRDVGFVSLMEMSGRSVKSALKVANRRSARFVVLIGEQEAQDGTVAVKDFSLGEQVTLERSLLVDWLHDRLV